MSGGFFDYKEYSIKLIIDKLEEYVDHFENGTQPPDSDYSKYYPELEIEYYGEDSTPEEKERLLKKFKEGIYHLKKAYIYSNRIDYCLSADDGLESFFKRLDEELKDLEEGKF